MSTRTSPYELRRRAGGTGSGGATRLAHDDDDQDRVQKTATHGGGQLNGWHWTAAFVATAGLVGVVSVCHDYTPEPVHPDGAGDGGGFSEVRALKLLMELASFGPKVSGSEANEVFARRLLVSELELVKNATAQTGVNLLEITTQTPSGCYDIPRFDGFHLCYKQVFNIVVRFGPKDTTPTKHSVLVNCHYDTWPDSPGASDDGVSCALMVEMLRVLAGHALPLPHDVIFLFNGAEENFLQAAHGFITQHPWRHSIRAFINLEAAGAGGRELLFQAGPGNQWLLNSYLEAAPRPHCSVVGQEVFQAGLVPGDTDFRIFRDHGRIPGLDLAYARNGYVYHTEFDTVQFITKGSVQRAGENILATLLHLLSSPYLEHPVEFGEMRFIFFDVLGLTTVVYSYWMGTVINAIVAAVAFVKIASNLAASQNGYELRHLIEAWKLQVGMAFAVFGTSLFLTQLVTYSGAGMAWYAHSWYVVPMYVVPCAVVGLTVHYYLMSHSHRLHENEMLERASFDAHMVFFLPILLLMVYHGLSSAFIFMLLVAFPVLRDVLLFVGRRFASRADTRFCVHLLCVAPCQAFNAYVVLMIVDIFVPILGRSLKAVNPEIPLAVLSALAVLVFILPTVHFLYSTQSIKTLLTLCAAGCVLFYLLIILTPVGDPFSFDELAPKTRRVHFTHGARRIYARDGALSTDSGLFILPYDFRPVEQLPNELLQDAHQLDTSISNDAFGHIPYYIPVSDILPPSSFRWRAVDEQLKFPHRTEISQINKLVNGNDRLNYSIVITGADHMTLFVTPQAGWLLESWSLADRSQNTTRTSAAFMSCGTGLAAQCSFDISIVLKRIHSRKDSVDGSELLIGLASQYVHGARKLSHTLSDIVDKIIAKRKDGDWRWAITPGYWTADYVSRYF